MKKPRVKDFDPNKAQRLGSSMDDLPAIERPSRRQVSLDRYNTPFKPEPSTQSQLVTPDRTGDRAIGRSLARIAFEVYQDQHASLKQFWLDEQARGEKGSMSQMVREAIDAYIAKRRDQKG